MSNRVRGAGKTDRTSLNRWLRSLTPEPVFNDDQRDDLPGFKTLSVPSGRVLTIDPDVRAK
ncbi:uncharacterized protein ANIA_11345 [Aspergillus nidulans FGSC A4]|uniref:Uncharacterized protein n=1 Tax=Emericella nidulans (strain FGSC A4 / ATCC 38163 / CBS 112.46 / NRRL 194 / M139) TaxID=227321 RepID=C8VPH5_EMENI|nr:hypothetical protein [Aspergillus nidulans FGSC A4]CBF86974.1 TPA: hypothetical protein ANIA_11345 [Aspergillus nidulans FGSC A4]